MTIETKTLKQSMLELYKKLNYNVKYGILFNEDYMYAANDRSYETVKLPQYISDSFVLPTKLLHIVGAMQGTTTTIIRDERYMQFISGDKHYVIDFAQDKDLDDTINDFTMNTVR